MKIVNVSNLSEDETIKTFNEGTNYAMYVANNEKESYDAYKNGELSIPTDSEMKTINILLVLERLGFPMDELGTYLYKDVIAEVIGLLTKKENMDEEMEMLSNLNNAFSDFYRFIARDDKEMGLQTFHLLIGNAIDQINDNIVDKKLVIDLFGYNHTEVNYGMLAFKLASYISNIYSMTIDKKVNRPLIKKLSNI